MSSRINIKDTDLSVCPFGFGTVDAGLAWDGAEADRLFGTFLEMVGNIIDSARIYSDWVKPEIARSERVIGQWLKRSGRRNDIILITKGGHPPLSDLHHTRCTRENMIYDLEQSLKQLGVDFIDIYFYHRDNTDLPAGELVEIMEGFVESGKIRYYGCSNWSAERMTEADNYAKAKGYRGFVANQMLFNIGSKYMKPFPDDTMTSMDDKMYSYHANNPQNLAMPYFGVCSGFFHRAEKEGLEALSNSPYYTPRNIELIGRIKSLREKYNASISQIVLGFFYTQAFSIAPLYGPYDVPQLIDAMKVMDIPFEPDDYKI